MKTTISFFIFFILLTLNLKAQVTQEWVARYNGLGNSADIATSMAVDGSGNVYTTGGGYGSIGDYATIKYNSAGIQQWVATYSGPGNSADIATSMAVDGSGNVYVTGESTGTGSSSDYATIKYNSAGVQQWVIRYNGPGNSSDGANSISIDGSGNVYVTGYSNGIGTSSDYATIKYNSAGVQQWVIRYNGPGNSSDLAGSISIDGSGYVYVTGESTGVGTSKDYATIKYDSDGIQQWITRYNGTGNSNDKVNSIAIDVSGNVYITGRSRGPGTDDDYATIKYNSGGIQQWVERYNGLLNSYDEAWSIVVDGSGNVFVTGSSGIIENTDYATIKYNSDGIQQWVTRYNGPGDGPDGARSISVDVSGNVYVAGGSLGLGTNADYTSLKYNSSGEQQWVTRYNGPGSEVDYGYTIFVDGTGNIYVGGYSWGNGTNYDYATVKYSQTIGINPISSIIPDNFNLSQNYPNPFNPTTNIEFSLPEKSFVKLEVFDITGKEVANLVNENLSAGTFRYDFNGENLPSGVYYYKLETSEFSQTKKMLLIK